MNSAEAESTSAARVVRARSVIGTVDASLGFANMRAGLTCGSRDLDSVLEAGRDLLGTRHHEVPIERSREALEGVDAIARSPTVFEPRDHGLGRAHPLGLLSLAEPRFDAQVGEELTEREILLGSPRPERAAAS